MALRNLAQQYVTTSGTATIVTLGAAVPGFLTFSGSGAANGETVPYGILDTSNTEAGNGVYTVSGTYGQLVRTTVINSTNSGNAISLTGNAVISITPNTTTIVGNDGWLPINATLTYSSADSPTFVATTSTDLSSIIPLGARIKLTQTTAKYFIVTAITSSTITLYGGTDYTLANAAITLPSYSLMKVPAGFNIDPLKWQQEFTSTSQVSQATPSANTWYNLGSQSLTIPIGTWMLYYNAHIWQQVGTDQNLDLTLSTTNNSASDSSMITSLRNSVTYPGQSMSSQKSYNLASKTIYYLNARSSLASNTLYIRGDSATTVIRATCNYL